MTKFFTFPRKLKSKLKSITRRFVTVNSDTKKKLILVFIALSTFNLLNSLLSIYTLISCGLLLIGAVFYLKLNLKSIHKKGLINYLPLKLQKTLLKRSLFDLLCDLWFIPRFSVYGKALLMPFIAKVEPGDAINQFKDVSSDTKKAIFTKGIINIMPESWQAIMLPQKGLIPEENSDISPIVEDGKAAGNVSGRVDKDIQIRENKRAIVDVSHNERSIAVKHPIRKNSYSGDHLERSSIQNKTTQASTDEDRLVNHNFSLSQQIEIKKTLPAFVDINPMSVHLDYQSHSKGINHSSQQVTVNKNLKYRGRGLLKKSNLDLKSQETNSNLESNERQQKIRSIKSQEDVFHRWDKLEAYTRRHRERLIKQVERSKKEPEMLELKGALKMLQHIELFLSKDALMNKLEGSKLLKIFLMSSLVLLLQFSISKKTRYWCYYTLHILFYITGFAISTGSLAILIIKTKARYQKWKKQQSMDIVYELDQEDEKEAIDQ